MGYCGGRSFEGAKLTMIRDSVRSSVVSRRRRQECCCGSRDVWEGARLNLGPAAANRRTFADELASKWVRGLSHPVLSAIIVDYCDHLL
jgi:hypothetical protein